MKAITFSLIFSVVISSLCVGWLMDIAYQQFLAPPNLDLEKKVSLLKLSGQSIANSLAYTSNKNMVIEQWNANKDISGELVNLDEIVLPNSLLLELKAGKALLLDSKDGPSFSYYIESSEQLLKVHSNTLFEEYDETSQWVLTIMFYVGLSLLLTLWVYPLAQRLYLLQQASAAFGKGKLNTRIEVGKVPGIKDVELAFNSMASRIETLLQDVKLLSGGVSHDLKTSLARLRFGIDTMQDDPESISDIHLARLSEDTDEMIHFVNSMLQYSQLDMHVSSLTKDTLVFSEVVNDVVSKISNRHPNKKIIFHAKKDDESDVILGHLVYVRMMLNNLISNAANYAKTSVNVSLSCAQEKLCLLIEDDGLGIDKQYHQDIFKPFFRVPEQSNSGKEKHYGLGLAIAQRIVQLHEGSIKLISTRHDDGLKNDRTLCDNNLLNKQISSGGISHSVSGTALYVYFKLQKSPHLSEESKATKRF